MGTFQSIISELIKTGVVINHYPQFHKFDVVDRADNKLVGFYTQKRSTQLAQQYNLPVNEYIRNRYYKFELKLKIEWKN